MSQFRIDVFSGLTELVDGYCSSSILGRSRGERFDLRLHDLRDGATDRHRSIDDAPFGGGAGMVMMPAPVFACVEAVESSQGLPRPLIAVAPSGTPFNQRRAEELAAGEGFSVLCGRYEGFDERILEHLVDDVVSIGDYVLAGGELAALVLVESVVRLLPGVLGNEESSGDESFTTDLLEYPQYTRPADFRSLAVPDVLLSGDHARIARWRRAAALRRTLERRPDLIEARGGLTDDEKALVEGTEA